MSGFFSRIWEIEKMKFEFLFDYWYVPIILGFLYLFLIVYSNSKTKE